MKNYGGPVIQNVEVIPIYWGAGWDTEPNRNLARQIDTFFDAIVVSTLIDVLQEYGLPGKPIGHGSRPASVHLPDNEPGSPVTDLHIQQMLRQWISDGTVPARTPNSLYILYLPPGCAFDGPPRTKGDCGYHWVVGISGIYYAVIQYPTPQCMYAPGLLDTMTVISSHELCEAITNPDPTSTRSIIPGIFQQGTWKNEADGVEEIGDVCRQRFVRVGPYLVQTVWSNRFSSCQPLAVREMDIASGMTAPAHPEPVHPDSGPRNRENRNNNQLLTEDEN